VGNAVHELDQTALLVGSRGEAPLAQIAERPQRRDYEPRLRKHAIPYLGELPLEEVTGPVLKAWLRQLARAGASDDTANRTLDRVQQVMRWSEAEGYATGARSWAYVAGPPRASAPTREVLSDLDMPEVAAIAKAVEGHYLAEYYRILLTLGPRPGELRGLLDTAIDHANRSIHLHHTLDWERDGVPVLEPAKTRKSQRTIRLPDSLWEPFAAYLDSRDRTPVLVLEGREWREVDLVFRRQDGGPLRGDGKGGVSDLFKRCLRRAGLPAKTLYDLRHIAVGLLLQVCKPEEVAQIVGHSSYRLTLDRYAPRMRELLASTAVSLDPIYRHLTEIGYAFKVSDEVSDPAE
jgi:integrase